MKELSPRIASLLFALSLISCGSSKDAVENMTTEQKFAAGKEALEDGNQTKAQEYFEVILLQDPASSLADDAQFYLAQSYYDQKEYYTAAFQYSRVLNDFPGSPFYKQALFMTGESYFKIAPQYERDQSKTETAIRQYKAFVGYFPSDSLTPIAQSRVTELRTRLAHRLYSIAVQYLGRDQFKAADLYFQKVIDQYADTEYYQLAIDGKNSLRGKIPATESGQAQGSASQ